MADTRRIIRSPQRSHEPANDAVPRTIETPPAVGITKRQRVTAATAATPEQVLPADPKRRRATVYNPAADLDGGGAQALVWVGFDDSQGSTFFPMETGAVVDVGPNDWFFAWSPSGSTLYIIEERD